MQEFNMIDIKKTEKELKKICKKYDIPFTAVDLILNHIALYNDAIEKFESGKESKPWTIIQLQGQIFNQLQNFKLTPPKKSIEIVENEEDNLAKINKKIERR